mmetsp:Transcript_6010/g.16842  ORF Transcript_6010/g.16842 Transcript_6010/m.16842 type:complete len:216 (-) Transcript_6010:481-1128(-)
MEDGPRVLVQVQARHAPIRHLEDRQRGDRPAHHGAWCVRRWPVAPGSSLLLRGLRDQLLADAGHLLPGSLLPRDLSRLGAHQAARQVSLHQVGDLLLVLARLPHLRAGLLWLHSLHAVLFCKHICQGAPGLHHLLRDDALRCRASLCLQLPRLSPLHWRVRRIQHHRQHHLVAREWLTAADGSSAFGGRQPARPGPRHCSQLSPHQQPLVLQFGL